ncbi:MAG: TolC family protein [Bacteroidota bacterium]
MKSFATFAIVSLLCFYTGSYSQKIWTLEECINYALENNIQIKQQKLNYDYSRNSYTQSKANVLPNLNGSIGENLNWGRYIDPYTNEFTDNNNNSMNLGLSSTVVLFNGFQNINTIKQNEYKLLASIEDIEKMKNDISMNIAAAYLQILYYKDMLLVAQNQVETTNFQIERTIKMVEAKSLPEGSLLEIQAQVAGEELQVITNQNQLDIAYLTLTQLLDLDTVAGFEILIPEFPDLNVQTINFSIEDIYKESLEKMPQIRSAEYNLKSAEKGLSIAKGGRSPRLSTTLSWGTGYSSAYENYFITDSSMVITTSGFTQIGTETYNVYSYYPQITYGSEKREFGEQLKNNRSTSLGFNLSIPIFNGLQTHTSISNAKISLLNSQYTLQLQKDQLYKDIQQKYTDVLAALKKYYSTKKALESLQTSFAYTKDKYEVGMVNFVDFNIAKNNLAKTSSDLLQAKYDYIFKTKILDFYRGIPIKL